MIPFSWLRLSLALAPCFILNAATAAEMAHLDMTSGAVWRNIGTFRGGGVSAVSSRCLKLPLRSKSAFADQPSITSKAISPQQSASRTQKRWLFIFKDLTNPAEVDRMIARFPAAQAAGYNGVVCSYNVARVKAADVRQAAKKYGLEIIATVFGGAHDRDYV